METRLSKLLLLESWIAVGPLSINVYMVIDSQAYNSGTTLVLLADEAFNAYAAALPGSKISEATGLLEIPEGTVNQMQSVFFDIGGVC